MKLTEFDDVDWIESPEWCKAAEKWFDRMANDLNNKEQFQHSQEFANARHAYRERINGKENDN